MKIHEAITVIQGYYIDTMRDYYKDITDEDKIALVADELARSDEIVATSSLSRLMKQAVYRYALGNTALLDDPTDDKVVLISYEFKAIIVLVKIGTSVVRVHDNGAFSDYIKSIIYQAKI